MPLYAPAGALLLAAASALALQMSAKQIVNVGPAPVGPYSPAVRAGSFIYLSGTLAQDDAGLIVGGDVAAQTRRVVERMREVLAASGSSLEQVVSVTVYLRSASDFQAMNDAYRAFWPKDPPTRTTVIADLVLPAALVEMTMIAVPAGAERRVIHPAGWVPSPNPYSYAIQSGDTLFLSGLVARRNGQDNSVVPGDIDTQMAVVMDNAATLLKTANMTFANVVSSRVYLPDTAVFQQMNAAYRRAFPKDPPARATVKAGLAGSQYSVEITMVASAARREVIADGRPANPNLSPAIRVGNTLYVSGMLGSTEATKGSVPAQTRETLSRIRNALTAAGFSPADVVDSLVYLPDLSTFAAMNSEYRTFFQKDFPARTTVGAGLVAPDGLVEIMVTAVKP